MATAGQKRKRTNSLTLIEILFVLLIIGIVSLGGWVAWRQGFATTQLRGATLKIDRKISLARTLAMAKGQPMTLLLTAQNHRLEGFLNGSNRPRFHVNVERCLWNGQPFHHLAISMNSRGELLTSGTLTLWEGSHEGEIKF